MELNEPAKALELQFVSGCFAEPSVVDMDQAFSDGLSLELHGSFILDEGSGPRGAKRMAEESYGNERFLQEDDGIVQQASHPASSRETPGKKAPHKRSRSASKPTRRFPKMPKFRRRMSSHSAVLPQITPRGGISNGAREVGPSIMRSNSLGLAEGEGYDRVRRRQSAVSLHASAGSAMPVRRRGSATSVDWNALPVGLVQMERRVSLGCASDQGSSLASSVTDETFSDCMSDCESDAYLSEFDGRDDDTPYYMRPPPSRYCAVTLPNLLRTQGSELTAYKHWLREVVKAPEEEIGSITPSLRMSIFCHFYRLEIPVSEIKAQMINDEQGWLEAGRRPHKVASFLRVPLSADGCSLWWLKQALPSPVDLEDNGCALICHMRQTVSEETMKGKKIQRRQERKALAKSLMANESVTVLATEDPKYFKKRDLYLKWVFYWATRSKTPGQLRIASCRTLSSLVYPYEVVPGLTDRLWQEGVVMRILRYSRRGNLITHEHVAIDDVKVGPLLDKGAAGKIYRAEWQGDVVAVKVCTENNISFEPTEFRFEVAIMCILNHPNILPCIGAHCYGPKYLLLTPFMVNGSLQSVLMDKSLKIGWKRRVMLALDVASALEYMHRYKVIHRDVKSANVVVGPDWTAVLTDFGTARVIGKHDKRAREKLIGTTEWMAPEMFHELKKEYNEKVDVYSFAIVLYEIITRSHPYSSLALKNWQIPEMVIAGERPPLPTGFECPVPALVDLMKACWNQSMKKRPSFARIVELLTKLKDCTLDDTVSKVDWMNPEKQSVDSTTGMMENLTDLDSSVSLHDALSFGSRLSHEPDFSLLCHSDSSGSSRHSSAGRSGSFSAPSTPETLLAAYPDLPCDVGSFLLDAQAVDSASPSAEHSALSARAQAGTTTVDAQDEHGSASLKVAFEFLDLKTSHDTESPDCKQALSPKASSTFYPRSALLEPNAAAIKAKSPRALLAAAATAQLKAEGSDEAMLRDSERKMLEKKPKKIKLLFARSKSNKTMRTDEINQDSVDPEPRIPSAIAPPGTITPRTDLFSGAGDDII